MDDVGVVVNVVSFLFVRLLTASGGSRFELSFPVI